jgi:hypothetical protein
MLVKHSQAVLGLKKVAIHLSQFPEELKAFEFVQSAIHALTGKFFITAPDEIELNESTHSA